jgi:hypothetical protein
MSWLPVPHLQQSSPGFCLPACVAMVSAYWEQPLLQEDVARWLGTRGIGTPASRIQRLTQQGLMCITPPGRLPNYNGGLPRQSL